MKTLNTRWRLIALVPLVAVAILSIGDRIGAVPDQNKEVREAANEGGIWIVGGITQGQILRFNVARLASGHPGGVNLELRVFDSHFFSIRRRHTRFDCDWSSDVCSSD